MIAKSQEEDERADCDATMLKLAGITQDISKIVLRDLQQSDLDLHVLD